MIETNTDKIRGMMAEQRITNRELAKRLGIAENTLNLKLKSGKFTTNELDIIACVLHITNPVDIFFPKYVAWRATKEN